MARLCRFFAAMDDGKRCRGKTCSKTMDKARYEELSKREFYNWLAQNLFPLNISVGFSYLTKKIFLFADTQKVWTNLEKLSPY